MTADPGFTVRKIASQIHMSFEQMLAYGLITEEQAREHGWTPPPPLPHLTRWKWAVRNWWHEHWPRIHIGPCNHEDCP